MSGSRTTRARRSIFLNMPFDDSYQEIRDAIVFAILDSGCYAPMRSGIQRLWTSAGQQDLQVDQVVQPGNPRHLDG